MLCQDGNRQLKSYIAAIRELEQSGFGGQDLALKETLDEATEGYFLNGKTEHVIRLVETGIARLKIEPTVKTIDWSILDLSHYFGPAQSSPLKYLELEYVGLLDEHLMFEALLNRRGGLEWLMKKAVSKVLKSGYASNQGSEYQHVVSLALLRMFETRKALKDLPLFEDVLQDEIFKREEFKELRNAVIAINRGMTHICLTQPGYGYREHVQAVEESASIQSHIWS